MGFLLLQGNFVEALEQGRRPARLEAETARLGSAGLEGHDLAGFIEYRAAAEALGGGRVVVVKILLEQVEDLALALGALVEFFENLVKHLERSRRMPPRHVK